MFMRVYAKTIKKATPLKKIPADQWLSGGPGGPVHPEVPF